jgi:hypothetical protein
MVLCLAIKLSKTLAMPFRTQNKMGIESLIERIFRETKERNNYQLLRQTNKADTSVHVLYRPESKRPEEHLFQYFI